MFHVTWTLIVCFIRPGGNKGATMCILLNSVSTERWKVGNRQSELVESCCKKEF